MLRIFALAAALAAAGAGSTAVAQPAEVCSVMVQAGDDIQLKGLSDYVVTGAALPLHLPEGYENVVALACDRPTLTIGDNDYRVLTDLELPLFVLSDDRTLSLEMVNGQLLVNLDDGELSDEEATAVQAALDRAQSLVQGASR